MDSKTLSKKEYFLSKYHQIIPHDFHMYWNLGLFPKLYLGKASFFFKAHDEPKEKPIWNWTFEFEETVPAFLKEAIIELSKTNTPSPKPKDVEFISYEDIYDYLFFRICPPHDDDDLGMKNFYKDVYSKIEDPEVKELVLDIIREWSQPGYCLSKHCQYILKEIEEKEPGL